MRIRQLVLVSDDRDLVVNDLCDLFKLEVAFYDPGISILVWKMPLSQ